MLGKLVSIDPLVLLLESVPTIKPAQLYSNPTIGDNDLIKKGNEYFKNLCGTT